MIGNAGIGNYLALSTLNPSSYILGASSTVAPWYTEGKIANSSLGWESTTDRGAGVDAELLNNPITLTIDYFYRHTHNMLFGMPLPVITSFGFYYANIGFMRTWGYE